MHDRAHGGAVQYNRCTISYFFINRCEYSTYGTVIFSEQADREGSVVVGLYEFAGPKRGHLCLNERAILRLLDWSASEEYASQANTRCTSLARVDTDLVTLLAGAIQKTATSYDTNDNSSTGLALLAVSAPQCIVPLGDCQRICEKDVLSDSHRVKKRVCHFVPR